MKFVRITIRVLENKRNSKNIFWKLLVAFKDFASVILRFSIKGKNIIISRFSLNNKLDKIKEEDNSQSIERWIQLNNIDDPVNNLMYTFQNLRYTLSYQWIKPLLKKSIKILDLGGETAFTKLIRHYNNCEVLVSDPDDLRYKINQPSSYYDLVLCMEVIEHIRDSEETPIDTFTGSGIKNMLSEAFRVLKPGGHLFLTTPNVCGWKNIYNLIDESHPFMYAPHHREFSYSDILKFVENAGFTVKKWSDVSCWNNHGLTENQIKELEKIVKKFGSIKHRRDNLFFLCKK